ncbi:g8809 [Coccomyxa viridis]|uniref:G8809 protein n=1 Tax=Coccomyxa viridis TaxID=1274662 RepID=A0ABP1G1B3_9CHLO
MPAAAPSERSSCVLHRDDDDTVITIDAGGTSQVPSRSTRVTRAQQSLVDDVYKKWKDTYLQKTPQGLLVQYNLAHDSEPKNAVTTSESIGYGMLISVLMGEQEDFSGLLDFYRNFVNPQFGLMKWQVLDNGNGHLEPSSIHSATDGDMDVAYALFKAEKTWPGKGYKETAKGICKALLTHCIKAGESHMPMTGDDAGPNDYNRLISRSSDWMPAHFKLFEQEDADNAGQWKATFEKTNAAYQRNLDQHPTGLLADFYMYDESHKVYNAATGRVHEKETDGSYWFNACRVPWRLAAYWKSYGKHAVEQSGLMPTMEALQKFFEKEVLSHGQVYGGYDLYGNRLNDWTSNSFLAPAWCLLKVMGSSKADDLEQKVREHLHDRYYADSILLLSMLETQ